MSGDSEIMKRLGHTLTSMSCANALLPTRGFPKVTTLIEVLAGRLSVK